MSQEGFTLIEMTVVLAILSIILVTVTPLFADYMERSKTNVCSINRQLLFKEYHLYLVMNGIKHSNLVLDKYILENGQNICPKQGSISAGEDIIQCSIHDKYEDKDDPGDGGEGDDDQVPYL
ncbi:MAG TPA: type II secretion system protein [Oscillospiraceae bacterium]|nr:type II secretion system protein [Oscillospiraceae bacterium]